MEFDLDIARQTLELADEAGRATTSFAKGFKTFRGLFQSSKSGADPEIKLALSSLALDVANAQAASAALIQKVTALEGQLREIKAHNSDMERYELWETAAGSIVHKLKDSDNAGEPMHYLCPQCAQKGVKAILQGDHDVKHCISCKSDFAWEMFFGRKR